jgi:hypothetical protein
MEQSSSWQVLGYSRNSLHFMELEGSLPYSQEPATCTYPEPLLRLPRMISPVTRSVYNTQHNYFFTVGSCHRLAQPPSWRTTPCRLSATVYLIYSELPSISAGRSSIRNLRTRHAVVTGTHLSPAVPYFPHSLIKCTIFRGEKVFEHKMCFDFLYNFYPKHLSFYE